MTDTTISGLPGGHAGALGGTEEIPCDQGGTTKYTTPADIKTYIGASPLEVTDGTTTVTAVTEINFTGGGATVSSGGAGIADVAITPGGGGGGGGGGGVDVLKLEAKGYVVVTNPNAGGTSLALSHATNVSGIAITARGRYQITFSSAIPSGCILMASGRFADNSSAAIADIGVDRHSGLGMGTATCDIAIVGAGESALLDNNFDPLWFYFEIRDPATTVAMAAVAGPSTVSALPASPAQGDRAFVTDATATTFLSTVAGGGSDKVPVVYDGTNWVIG